ncbi:MerR family transcriptional regulator [Thioalkalivibrio denitrificans]|uniref:MerR family transcriptional regulator n=1 Tax=Thioalkalivibrio denitrificans TaxID=108003 RepID=A0A1V3NV31_9GAMM|nr:helix-turn-helix domain-containing protein [Thioalkalivibrio denitrificans]OOG28813.1 MerR family transcriptional regulator [Thioalkalivibrio denitrificans]
MRIGELARQTGCQVETIRYYERVGILPEPKRGQNNYRHYVDAHRRRLQFVRRCRELGFTLEEVRTLLSMIDGGTYSCAEVEALGRGHLEAVRSKIADLRQMESTLSELVSTCHGGDTPDCSFLEELFEGQFEHKAAQQ